MSSKTNQTNICFPPSRLLTHFFSKKNKIFEKIKFVYQSTTHRIRSICSVV